MTDAPRPLRAHRLGVIALFAVLILAATFLDDPSGERTPVRIPDQVQGAQIGAATFSAPSRTSRDRSLPVAARRGAASVTWFCGGGPAANTKLVLTNRADAKRRVQISATVVDGEAVTRELDLPGGTTQELAGDFAGQGVLAATIESRHAGVVAAQRVSGGDAVTTASCATSSSSSWYFADGDTERGASETVVLFNPFDELATVDVTFLTVDGFRRPQATQGLAVPGRSVVQVDIGEVQNRRTDMGAAVTTRAGRVVAWRHQSFDGTGADLAGGAPAKGVSLALGQSVPLTRFVLPGAVTGEGVTPRIVIANPGAETSTVRLHFAVDDPAANGQPPDRTVELLSGAVEVIEGDGLRQVPAGVPFSISGRVVSGGAVVAELWMNGNEPARGHGAFATTASGVAAISWVSPRGLPDPVIDQLALHATGGAARVEVSVVDGSAEGGTRRIGEPVVVAAGERVSLDLGALLADRPGATVVVGSDEPVVVSRLQTGPDERGLVSPFAIPVAGRLTDP